VIFRRGTRGLQPGGGGGSTGLLTYHNGYVDTGGTYAYDIFWEPSNASNYSTYNSRMNSFFGDINGTGYYNDLTQYYEISGDAVNIVNHSQLVSSWLDTTNAYPGAALQSSDILAEVNRAISANGWSPGSFSQINVFVGSGETLIQPGYCGFHDSGTSNLGYVVQYAAVAYLSACNNATCPNNCYIDTGLNVLSHETFEATTNPFPAGECSTGTTGGWWYDGQGQCTGEIGDLCASNFDSVTLDGGQANHYWNGRYYILQDEWDNLAKGCTTSGP
jgi:hypothetical protein